MTEPLDASQRPLLLFHRHLRAVRAAGDPPTDYDILMLSPPAADDEPPDSPAAAEAGRWRRVPAAKYLKRRAQEWREAERLEDLPAEFRELAASLDYSLCGLTEFDRPAEYDQTGAPDGSPRLDQPAEYDQTGAPDGSARLNAEGGPA